MLYTVRKSYTLLIPEHFDACYCYNIIHYSHLVYCITLWQLVLTTKYGGEGLVIIDTYTFTTSCVTIRLLK